jgi:hypothetical protein
MDHHTKKEMKMKNRKIPVHNIFTIVYITLAIVASLPTGTASKDCLLGYNALCSFTPIGTVILFTLAGLHIYLHKKALAKIEL